MNAINEITNLYGSSTGKNYNKYLMRCSCRQQTSDVTRGLSWRGNLAERGQLVSVGDLQVTNQKKTEIMVNPGAAGYTKTSNQRKISEKGKKTTTY